MYPSLEYPHGSNNHQLSEERKPPRNNSNIENQVAARSLGESVDFTIGESFKPKKQNKKPL